MQNVRLFHLAEQDPEPVDRMALPIHLGEDSTGQPLVVDLAALPHLLVAGQTENTKTACLHRIIVSILTTRTPEQVRLILIDPNQTAFSRFRTAPHLLRPVVADPNEADTIFAWAIEQTQRRQRLFAESGVRRLDKYNRLQKISLRQPLPNIVIVADEITDLLFASKEAERNIVRLAQNRQQVGIHLVLATEIKNVHAFAGHVKAQIPTRIALALASEPERGNTLNREIDALVEGFRSAGQAFDNELVVLTACEELSSNDAPNLENAPLRFPRDTP